MENVSFTTLVDTNQGTTKEKDENKKIQVCFNQTTRIGFWAFELYNKKSF
jgi:hypothetical protein